MQWNYVITGLVEIVTLVGPGLLYHHVKIRAIVKAVGAIADAASADSVSMDK